MITRVPPNKRFLNKPCSYVGVGIAYEKLNKSIFKGEVSEKCDNTGYLSLNNANEYIREYLPVKKKAYYKRGERPILEDFLASNYDRCIICVYGHFIYADGDKYWSFFNNDKDEIVCVWYLK